MDSKDFTIVRLDGGIAFPAKGDNIKRFGVERVLDIRSDAKAVFTIFHALNGSATLLPDVARTRPNITFLLFAFNVHGDVIKKFANQFVIPNNFVIYGVHHPNKGKTKDYNKLYLFQHGTNKRFILNCESSETDYALGIRLRTDALYQFAVSKHSRQTIRFEYAFDNNIFRMCMLDWFMGQFANVDFTGIKYVATVAGSGLTSYTLAKALSLLGVTGISFLLVSVGADLSVVDHEILYPTLVVKTPTHYLDEFDFANLPDDIRCRFASVGVTKAGYDGKVFYPFLGDADYNWDNTLFLLVRNE